MTKIARIIITMFIIQAVTITAAHSQNDNSAAIAAADSSHFSVNLAGGWQLFNSFAEPLHADSVQVELILQQNGLINWQADQFVGTIKPASLKPVSARNIVYSLMQDKYLIRVEPDGKCFLHLTAGSPPQSSPAVLFVKFVYLK
jgi:hypothetical protein